MGNKVYSFRAPDDFVPAGMSVKDFVFDLYKRASTPVNTDVDANISGDKQSGFQVIERHSLSDFMLGAILSSLFFFILIYLPLKEKLEKERKKYEIKEVL